MKPGFIRVDADEVSYPAHVILRYEIERALIDGEIEVDDIRRCGTRKCSTGWGCRPPATIGMVACRIFTGPTADSAISLPIPGAMYAAQLMARPAALPTLDRDIEEGDFSALFDWLRQNIWQHGSRFTTSQLIQQATGEDLNSRYFREHLTTRYL